MRFKGRHVRLGAAPRPRGQSGHETIRDQANKIRQLRHRISRKTAALQTVVLLWESEEDLEPEDYDYMLATAKEAMIL